MPRIPICRLQCAREECRRQKHVGTPPLGSIPHVLCVTRAPYVVFRLSLPQQRDAYNEPSSARLPSNSRGATEQAGLSSAPMWRRLCIGEFSGTAVPKTGLYHMNSPMLTSEGKGGPHQSISPSTAVQETGLCHMRCFDAPRECRHWLQRACRLSVDTWVLNALEASPCPMCSERPGDPKSAKRGSGAYWRKAFPLWRASFGYSTHRQYSPHVPSAWVLHP